MNRFSLFLLFISLLLSIFLLSISCSRTSRVEELHSLTVREARTLIDKEGQQGHFAIIDIRTPDEFKQGHLKDAINIDFYGKDFQARIEKLDRQNFYLIYCRTQGRSSKALDLFRSLKFTKAYNMDGGFSRWEQEGFPVSR